MHFDIFYNNSLAVYEHELYLGSAINMSDVQSYFAYPTGIYGET